MNYFDITYTALGGLAIFFLGLKYLSESLQSSGQEAIKRILASLTRNRVMAVLAGVGITVFVQSSSISTVMTVSLVNAGLMELKQAIGVILPAAVACHARQDLCCAGPGVHRSGIHEWCVCPAA